MVPALVVFVRRGGRKLRVVENIAVDGVRQDLSVKQVSQYYDK